MHTNWIESLVLRLRVVDLENSTLYPRYICFWYLVGVTSYTNLHIHFTANFNSIHSNTVYTYKRLWNQNEFNKASKTHGT